MLERRFDRAVEEFFTGAIFEVCDQDPTALSKLEATVIRTVRQSSPRGDGETNEDGDSGRGDPPTLG